MDELLAMKELVADLQTYRDAYYNQDESIISDLEYDNLVDKLKELETRTGVVLSNSPTINVGYPVASCLNKVTHDHPMLSLDKTKDINKIFDYFRGKKVIVMGKMDGLTCSLKYRGGTLVSAETRGDGIEGEDITHNVNSIRDIPLQLSNFDADDTTEIVIDGEIIITKDNFAVVKEKCVDKNGKKYKNARNLAAGSVRQLDSKKCSERRVQFVAWKLIRGFDVETMQEGLDKLYQLGFNVVPYRVVDDNVDSYKKMSDEIEQHCGALSYPIDGCVFSCDSIDLLERMGATDHHLRGQMAYKFYDELYETTVRYIDWTMGKTGILTPTAVFDTVEIDGTDVSRASLHNLTIMSKLNVRKNCTARVFKANMIIPQIDSTDDDGDELFEIPTHCPICGGETMRMMDNDSEMLLCTNNYCEGKILGKLCAFVSKSAMDIDGLSEGKLQFLLDNNYIKNEIDLYSLKDRKEDLYCEDGWGKTSVDNLLEAIEASKNVTVERFLTALSIPNVGLATAKVISKYFDHDINKVREAFVTGFNWMLLEGFGERSSQLMNKWFDHNSGLFTLLASFMNFTKPEAPKVVFTGSPINGKTFCITGTFEYPRSSIRKEIEGRGGIWIDSVSRKTDVLFVGDKAGSKLKKAEQLGIKVVTADEMYDYLGGVFNA